MFLFFIQVKAGDDREPEELTQHEEKFAPPIMFEPPASSFDPNSLPSEVNKTNSAYISASDQAQIAVMEDQSAVISATDSTFFALGMIVIIIIIMKLIEISFLFMFFFENDECLVGPPQMSLGPAVGSSEGFFGLIFTFYLPFFNFSFVV